MKRLFDFSFALAALVLLAPILAGLALWLWRQFRRWPVFCQTRIGRGGIPFRIYKLRSLDPVTGKRLEGLRRLGLDELPQLLNILRGEMSIVGPRPLIPAETDPQDQRHLLRPGLTGWAQIHGRDLAPAARGRHDAEYRARASFAFDLGILLMTTPIVLGFKPGLPLPTKGLSVTRFAQTDHSVPSAN